MTRNSSNKEGCSLNAKLLVRIQAHGDVATHQMISQAILIFSNRRRIDICTYDSILCKMLESMDGFDWDAANIDKCRKHGVSLDDIESLFNRTVDVFPDVRHSVEETRYLAIGTSDSGRFVFLAFTKRSIEGRLLIRPISARYMHAKEISHYLKEAARRQD